MTTRICPSCGSDAMVPLPSLNLKICCDCKTETPWHLTAGQTPVLTSSRDTRKPKE